MKLCGVHPKVLPPQICAAYVRADELEEEAGEKCRIALEDAGDDWLIRVTPVENPGNEVTELISKT